MRGTTRSPQGRAVAKESGVGVSPGRSAAVPVDFIIERIKE